MQHEETPAQPSGPDAGDEPTLRLDALPARTGRAETGLGGLTWTRWSLAADERDNTGDPAEPPAEPPAGPDEDTRELPLLTADDPTPVTAVPAAPDDLLPPPATTGRRRLALAAGAGLLLAGALAVAALDRDTTATPQPAAGGARWSAAPGHTVSRPFDGRTESALDLVSAASAVTVRSAALGGDLYRISTPPGGVRPHAADAGGRVRLSLDGTGGRTVEIVLNERVRWDLSVAGGAEQHRIDLSESRLRRVDLAGGAGRIVLTLPRPEGTLVVRMAGGVREFAVHTVTGAPVRVRVGSGAGRVVLGGRTHAGVAAGSRFTPERWDDTGDRIDLDAVAGLAQLTVDAT